MPQFWHLLAPIPAPKVPFWACKPGFYSFPTRPGVPLHLRPLSVQGQDLVAGPGQEKSSEGVSLTEGLQFDLYAMYIFITGTFFGDSTFSMQQEFILCEALLMATFDFISVLL